MELAFALDAVRRYGWIIVVCALLGAIPGILRDSDVAALFESRAVMILAPARDVRTQISLSGANERYVLGQLEVIRSSSLAERVSTEIGFSGGDIRQLVSVEHDVQTDVVAVIVRGGTPELAEAIANGYVETYVELLAEQVDTTQSPQVDDIGDELDVLRAQLGDVDAAIASAMAPYLELASVPDVQIAVPTIEQVVPQLYSERQLLLSKYLDLQAAQTQLQVGSPFVVATEIVERATAATPVPRGPGALLVVAGLMVGGLVGLFLTLVLGRFTPRLMSRRHAEELLGIEVLGPLEVGSDHAASLVGSRSLSAHAALAEISWFVDVASVGPGPHTVLVTETTSASDAIPVALAVATTFALSGTRTVLVEGERNDQSLGTEIISSGPHRGPWLEDGLAPTEQKMLALYTAGPSGAPWTPNDVDELNHVVRSVADRVVVAAGRLGQGTLLQLLAGKSAAVVVVLNRRTPTSALDVAIAQLRDRGPTVIAVWASEPSRRRGRSSARRSNRGRSGVGSSDVPETVAAGVAD